MAVSTREISRSEPNMSFSNPFGGGLAPSNSTWRIMQHNLESCASKTVHHSRCTMHHNNT